MAAVGTVQVQCPDCGLDVPITLEPRSTTGQGRKLMIVMEPDYTDLWAHTWLRDLE